MIVSSILSVPDPVASDVRVEIVGVSASIAGVSPNAGEVVNAVLELTPSVSMTLIGICADSALAVSPSEIT